MDADAPLIRLVNQIIVDAFKMRASDIHLEPLANVSGCAYRIDGMLHEMKAPPKRLQASIITRLKIQSNMSISEHRIPQDGRIQSKVGNKLIDLRVSCLPTNHGESIVMRILDKEGLRLGLPELGFFTDDQQTFERMIGLPDGILLVTGPTGSGKTTTLYSCLHFINRPDRKIITVEDPVEYILSGINQVQVNEAVGLTFAAALRSILRQAPNVVMIGEIRDMETASIAINASLTGHLVFSTLHTNDAPSAVTRLVDIGVKPFLVASSTRCLMAQRLVRKVCRQCAQPYQPTEQELRALNLTPENMQTATMQKGRGCSNCSNTGCRGRMGIFEIFIIDDEARKLIYDKALVVRVARPRPGNGHAHAARGRHSQGARRPDHARGGHPGDRRRRILTRETILCHTPCPICCSWWCRKAPPTCTSAWARRRPSGCTASCTASRARRSRRRIPRN